MPQSFRSMWDLTSATGSAFAHLVSPAGLSSYAKDFTSKNGSHRARWLVVELVELVVERGPPGLDHRDRHPGRTRS